MFQKSNAMADFSVWFNLRFQKCFVLVSKFLFVQCTLVHTVYSYFVNHWFFQTRTKEHFKNLRLNHTEKSAIASQFWNTGHEINNSAILLKPVNRKNELIIWEKISINTHITLWILKSCQLVHSLKSMCGNHQTGHRWHQSASQCKTLQLIWIENGWNIAQNNCLQVCKLP